jgi:oligopeptide/dipeptide ABC transporter ATP-binding protein
VRNLPPGCPFAPRCTYRRDVCTDEYPPVTDVGGGHQVACWAVDEILAKHPQVEGVTG